MVTFHQYSRMLYPLCALLFLLGNTLHKMLLNSLCKLVSHYVLIWGIHSFVVNRYFKSTIFSLCKILLLELLLVPNQENTSHIFLRIYTDFPFRTKSFSKYWCWYVADILPPYSSELLQPYHEITVLWDHILIHLYFNRECWSNLSRVKSAIAAPFLWNNLSEHVKLSQSLASFKRSLKTHLMQTV